MNETDKFVEYLCTNKLTITKLFDNNYYIDTHFKNYQDFLSLNGLVINKYYYYLKCYIINEFSSEHKKKYIKNYIKKHIIKNIDIRITTVYYILENPVNYLLHYYGTNIKINKYSYYLKYLYPKFKNNLKIEYDHGLYNRFIDNLYKKKYFKIKNIKFFIFIILKK
jgi:hypothetical protein